MKLTKEQRAELKDLYDTGDSLGENEYHQAIYKLLGSIPALLADLEEAEAAIEAAVEPYKPLISAGMYQFLSDVITSAGLLRHGKTDKGLAERISNRAMMFMGAVSALSAKEAP